jgi:hypothetical protein
MKKCNIYLDYVNSESFDENDSKSFNDILIHTEHCTDCSFDRKMREKLLYTLSCQANPDYPDNLHEITMNNISEGNNESSTSEPNIISKLMLSLLKPLEIAVPAASVLMLFFMIQLNSSNEMELSQIETDKTNALKKIRVAEANENINDEGMPKVSSEEVKEFLDKLDEFQRLHPDDKFTIKRIQPDVRLVGSK